MKTVVMYDYPPSPGGLATQGDLLFRGLKELGVDAHAVHFESAQEKEWYYRWFEPDVVVGIGYWGHTPHLVLHPQRHGVQPVPWLVANGSEGPAWKYVCKVWPQKRTETQNMDDLQLAHDLGIEKNVLFAMSINSRNYLPYLIAACDIYAAPSRLEGFGMPMVEAGACGKPVIGIRAMAMLDTLVHGETALLADVATEVWIREAIVGEDQGFDSTRRIVFPNSRASDYRASVHNIAEHLRTLMGDAALRRKMGAAGRARVRANYDYRVVTRRFVELVGEKLGVS